MSDIKRRLAKMEQQAAAEGSGEDRSQAARCRAAAETYLALIRALRPDYHLPKPLPPPSLPISRARAAFVALLKAVAEQGQGQRDSTAEGQPTDDNESDRHEKRCPS